MTSPKSKASYFLGPMTFCVISPVSKTFISTFTPIFSQSVFKSSAAALSSGVFAVEIEKEEGIVLTEQHYGIMEFLRKRFLSGDNLSIRSINSSGVIDVKTFYSLFPGAPLKKATKIAGIPKPASCI